MTKHHSKHRSQSSNVNSVMKPVMDMATVGIVAATGVNMTAQITSAFKK